MSWTQPGRLGLLLVVLFTVLAAGRSACGQVDLSPARWGVGELARYGAADPTPEAVSEGESGMVVGTSYPLAIRSGLEALRQGGTAMDAALTVSLTSLLARW